MRLKFELPREPNETELLFINVLEESQVQYNEDTLSFLCDTDARTLRTFKERYNNRKYINIVPQGNIVCIKGIYTLVRPNSELANKYILKARLDIMCSSINNHNTRLNLGDIQCNGQISFDDQLYSIEEIINMANKLSDDLGGK